MISVGIEVNYTYFFNKQPVYKQLVLGWKITKQLLRLNPLSRSNNKNNKLKKWSFSFAINLK